MIAGQPGSNSRRKSLESDINLVPFIDLLSMCICFLLMTAVWIQIGSMQVKQSHGTEGPATNSPFSMDVAFTGRYSLLLQLKKNGKVASKVSIDETSLPGMLTKLDGSIDPLLRSMGEVPDPKVELGSKVSSAIVQTKNVVPYGDLVSAMDILRKHQIVNLGVSPTGGT